MSLFDASGLKARTAAAHVAAAGPLRYAQDGEFWAYADGVWAPGGREVHRRIVRLLGERYRPAHREAVLDVLRAVLDEHVVGPVQRYVNFRNGMLDWADELMPRLIGHDPGFGSTVQLPIEWTPETAVDCDEFEKFLAEAVAIDDRQRVWEILGYLMMSGNPLQRLFLFTGGGGNGKGVLLSVIGALLGRRNVSSVPLADFAESQFATAEVFGKLANICGDIDATYIERTGRIKELSGEDLVKGERKYGQPWYFEFWGKALFSANAIPTSADSSTGWLRRWEIVHFPNEPSTPDRTLKTRLCAPTSLQAIAVRAVLALRDLMARGTFDHGESAAHAHREFAVRNNKLLGWIDDCGWLDPSHWYPRDDLLRSYRLWEHGQNPGGRAINAATFYERLRQIKGVRDAKIRGTRGFYGVRLGRDAHVVEVDDLPPEGGGPTENRDQMSLDL